MGIYNGYVITSKCQPLLVYFQAESSNERRLLLLKVPGILQRIV